MMVTQDLPTAEHPESHGAVAITVSVSEHMPNRGRAFRKAVDKVKGHSHTLLTCLQ